VAETVMVADGCALLTLIMALDVMRKSVARSLTCLIFSELSGGSLRFSSSLSERCKAVPCLAMRSLHVDRSSTLLVRVRSVFCTSVLSVCEAGSSSAESSVNRRGHQIIGYESNHHLQLEGAVGLMSALQSHSPKGNQSNSSFTSPTYGRSRFINNTHRELLKLHL